MGSFNFGEYASLKNGSYRKLIKANYAEQKKSSEVTKEQTKPNKNVINTIAASDKTGLAKIKTEADSLKDASKALKSDELWKKNNGSYDMGKIADAVKNFANEYNDVVSQSAKVSSKDVSMQTGFMTNLTKTMSGALSKIGISVGEDGKMSVDENELKKSNVKDISSMFSGKYSFASQIEDKAGAISSAASRGAGTYSANGTWSSTMPGTFSCWM